MKSYDVVIIGGGIVGLATGYQLLQENPGLKLAILEKEDELACHQSGNNSGVLNTGIYYKPGSLKARNCALGLQELIKFCDENEVPYQNVGKVIVATNEMEIEGLEELERRGRANGVQGLRMLSHGELKDVEPHCKGFGKESKETSQTVQQWLEGQHVKKHNVENDKLMELISLKNRILPGKLEGAQSDKFYMALYDLDEFRFQIMNNGLLDEFEIPKKLLEYLNNDETLLDFGIEWVKNQLFGIEIDLKG